MTRTAEIFRPSASSTPVAFRPFWSPSTIIRLSEIFVWISTPALTAAIFKALIKLSIPPSGSEWAPWSLPLIRYSILRTVALGERGAIFDPTNPSQLRTAFKISLSKFSSIKSRAGSVATRINSPISFLPSIRKFSPRWPKVMRSGTVFWPIRGIVLSQNGFSTLAKRLSTTRYSEYFSASSMLTPLTWSPEITTGIPCKFRPIVSRVSPLGLNPWAERFNSLATVSEKWLRLCATDTL